MSDTAPATHDPKDAPFLRGVLWTTAGRWTIHLLTFVTSILVARRLSPGDYGVVGMAWVYAGFIQMIGELGVGLTIVQRRALGHEVIQSLATPSVLAGVCLAAVSWPAGRLMAWFYGDARVEAVVGVYGLTFLVSSLRSVPVGLLARDFEFQKSTLVVVGEALVGAAGSLAFVYAGFGYWALVLGNFCGTATGAILARSLRPVSFRSPRLALRAEGVVTFSRNVLTDRLGWYLYSRADALIIGRLLGSRQLGYYALASQLATVPLERLTAGIMQMVHPMLASIAHDRMRVRQYFRSVVEAVAIIALPIAIGIAGLSGPLVTGVLGDGWRPAAAPLAILSLATLCKLFTALTFQVIVVMGEARYIAGRTLVALCTLPPLFAIASREGIIGVALVWCCGYPVLVAWPAWRKAASVLSMPARDLAGLVWPYFCAAIVATGAGVAVMRLPLAASGMRVALAVSVTAATYAGYLLMFHGARLLRFLDLIRRAMAPGRQH
jgi:O-antigen/teichoic acid export membrane protein